MGHFIVGLFVLLSGIAMLAGLGWLVWGLFVHMCPLTNWIIPNMFVGKRLYKVEDASYDRATRKWTLKYEYLDIIGRMPGRMSSFLTAKGSFSLPMDEAPGRSNTPAFANSDWGERTMDADMIAMMWLGIRTKAYVPFGSPLDNYSEEQKRFDKAKGDGPPKGVQ